MKSLILILIGAIGGGSATAMVYSNHIVQTPDKWLFVPRAGVNVKDIYADVRTWGLDDWRKHPELSRDMVKAGYAEIIQTGSVDRVVDEVYDRLTQRPEPERASNPVWEEDTPNQSGRAADDFQPDSIPE